ncbi:MAG: beta-glucanase [Cytophagaceae bacterium]|nr:MAG: beta-glucanase [Cytophagaceae bacterium]
MNTRSLGFVERLGIAVLLMGVGIGAIQVPSLAQKPTAYASFKPGAVWLADDGLPIDCHGGNIIYIDSLKTFYWYGEHRGEPRGAACYSSKDLYNWKNEGVVLKKGAIEVFERPKVIYDATRHRYVMWFHYDGNRYTVAELGVAISDKPTGPFVVQHHSRPNDHESRDIGLFMDPETQKAYIGYAADHVNRTIRMVELSGDYLSTTAQDTDIEAHCEGPGILKQNGVYYLLTSGCSGWTPNPATYYTASSLMGPYTSQGNPFIGDVGNNSFNSQPCYIFKIPGYKNAYLYMGDRWNGGGHADSQYVFLPITITPAGKMELHWYAEWNLNLFTPEKTAR